MHQIHQRPTSWLRAARNPVKSLVPGPPTGVVLQGSVEEDTRLARVVAAHTLPRQDRVLPPNNVLAVVVGCGYHGCNVAAELLRRGCTVRLVDHKSQAARDARSNIERRLLVFVTEGCVALSHALSEPPAQSALSDKRA